MPKIRREDYDFAVVGIQYIGWRNMTGMRQPRNSFWKPKGTAPSSIMGYLYVVDPAKNSSLMNMRLLIATATKRNSPRTQAQTTRLVNYVGEFAVNRVLKLPNDGGAITQQ